MTERIFSDHDHSLLSLVLTTVQAERIVEEERNEFSGYPVIGETVPVLFGGANEMKLSVSMMDVKILK
jgi:uncharacterized membrane protein